MCEGDNCVLGWILGGAFVLFAVIGAFLIGTGWALGNQKNGNLVAAVCVTSNYLSVTSSCFVSCCSHDAEGDCLSCFRTCYHGYLLVNITNVASESKLQSGTTFVSSVSILADMKVAYPVGTEKNCYYDRTTAIPGIATAGVSVQWTLIPTYDFFIAAMVMFAFAGVCIIAACVFICPWLLSDCRSNCLSDCLSDCRARHQGKRRKRLAAEQLKGQEEQRKEEQQSSQLSKSELIEMTNLSQVPPVPDTSEIPTAPPAPLTFDV